MGDFGFYGGLDESDDVHSSFSVFPVVVEKRKIFFGFFGLWMKFKKKNKARTWIGKR